MLTNEPVHGVLNIRMKFHRSVRTRTRSPARPLHYYRRGRLRRVFYQRG